MMISDTPPILEVAGLVAERRSRGAVFRLEIEALRLVAGEAVAVMGPSGSGKSTLLNVLGLALTPIRAERFVLGSRRHSAYDARPLFRTARADSIIRAERIGYVTQTADLLSFLTLFENVALTLELVGRRDSSRVLRMLASVGVDHLARSLPRAMSSGERQRGAIARALVHEPDVVLADEPTSALDASNAEAVFSLLLRTAEVEGAALIVVSHDEALVRRHGVRILRLEPDVTASGVPVSRLEAAA
jgi:putative ABC transport system ATP-binding protein